MAVTSTSTRMFGQTSAGTTANLNTGWCVMTSDRTLAYVGMSAASVKPLADAYDIGERGAGTVERLLDVPPCLCDFLGEIFGQCSVGAQARTASA